MKPHTLHEMFADNFNNFLALLPSVVQIISSL